MAANQPNPAEVLWGQTLLVGHCPAHNGGMGVGWWRMGATPLSHCDSLPVTAAGLPNIIPPPFQHLLSSFEQPISSFSKSLPILYPSLLFRRQRSNQFDGPMLFKAVWNVYILV